MLLCIGKHQIYILGVHWIPNCFANNTTGHQIDCTLYLCRMLLVKFVLLIHSGLIVYLLNTSNLNSSWYVCLIFLIVTVSVYLWNCRKMHPLVPITNLCHFQRWKLHLEQKKISDLSPIQAVKKGCKKNCLQWIPIACNFLCISLSMQVIYAEEKKQGNQVQSSHFSLKQI